MTFSGYYETDFGARLFSEEGDSEYRCALALYNTIGSGAFGVDRAANDPELIGAVACFWRSYDFICDQGEV